MSDILNKDNRSVLTINPSNVEGSMCVKEVQLMKLSKIKIFFFILISILSGGSILLVCYIFPRYWKKVLFSNGSLIEHATHVQIIDQKSKITIEKLKRIDNKSIYPSQLVYFSHKMLKYFYCQRINQFSALHFDVETQSLTEISSSQPLEEEQLPYLHQLYGENKIHIEIPNYFQFLSTEIVKPLNWLLYFGIIIWMFYSFFLFAGSTIVFFLITYTIIYLYVRKAKLQLKQACDHDLILKVMRGSQIISISSRLIYPGDIVLLNDNNITLPFDAILLQGLIQVNEANITGESAPIIKNPIQLKAELFNFKKQHSSVLIEGTVILKLEDSEARVLVVRTGFHSLKGQLIRSILFPSPQNYKFFLDGGKLCILAMIVSLVAYIITLPTFLMTKLPLKMIIFRLCDIIINSFPPAVPLLISQAVFFSFARLKKKNILGSDTSQALQAGRVNTICFDKTGTLTESFVDFIGYQLPTQLISDEIKSEGDKESILFKLFSICHQASEIEGAYVGDTIDIKMLQFSGWKSKYDLERKLTYSQFGSHKLYNILTNEFHSEYQCMSVIAEEEENNETVYFFIKGSPEIIISKLTNQENKKKLQIQLNYLALQGYRILSTAYKEIPKESVKEFLTLKRGEQEQGLTFLAFLIFKNTIKPQTKEIIEELKNADYNLKIITGDNPITSFKIGLECGIFTSPQQPLLIIDKSDQNTTQLSLIELSSNKISNVHNLKTQHDRNDLIIYCVEAIKNRRNLCLTGGALDVLEKAQQEQIYSTSTGIYTEQDECIGKESIDQKLFSFYSLLVLNTQLFARMSPSQKGSLIKRIKLNGEVTCMVGDGANDCSAIKEADVGISFSDSDGSHSAQFISKNKQIDCVKQILLEGRLCLSVGSESFKGHIQISTMRYFSYLALQHFYSSLNDFQMIFTTHICGFISILWFQGMGTAPKILTKSMPIESMGDFQNIISMSFGFIVQVVAIVSSLSLLKESSSYREPTGYYQNSFFFMCQQNTVLFFYNVIFICYTILANYTSSPMKRPIYKNILAFSCLLFQFIYVQLIMITPQAYIKLLYLADIKDVELRIKIIFLLNGLGILQAAFERVFVKGWMQRRFEEKRKKEKSKMEQSLIRNVLK